MTDEAGRCPRGEALAELLVLADGAADGVTAVLTEEGSREMRRLADQLRRRSVGHFSRCAACSPRSIACAPGAAVAR